MPRRAGRSAAATCAGIETFGARQGKNDRIVVAAQLGCLQRRVVDVSIGASGSQFLGTAGGSQIAKLARRHQHARFERANRRHYMTLPRRPGFCPASPDAGHVGDAFVQFGA